MVWPLHCSLVYEGAVPGTVLHSRDRWVEFCSFIEGPFVVACPAWIAGTATTTVPTVKGHTRPEWQPNLAQSKDKPILLAEADSRWWYVTIAGV